MTLAQLRRALLEMVAMAADENQIGKSEADDWADALQDAVMSGLEAAYDRK